MVWQAGTLGSAVVLFMLWIPGLKRGQAARTRSTLPPQAASDAWSSREDLPRKER